MYKILLFKWICMDLRTEKIRIVMKQIKAQRSMHICCAASKCKFMYVDCGIIVEIEHIYFNQNS